MNIEQVLLKKRSFELIWSDGSITEAPFIWLRDNDQQELHPKTGERTFDLTSVPLDITPLDFTFTHTESVKDTLISINWPNKNTPSQYSAKWLLDHKLGHARFDPADIERSSWAANEMQSLPRFSAKDCYQDKDKLINALSMLKQTGIILIDELEDDLHAGDKFGDLIGFKRESNYGAIFQVFSKPEPNNLAFTSLELPLHTDLPNQEFVPGNQFLHCYRNEATGGGSMFADAMVIIEDLKREQPKHYKTLCELKVPWCFLDDKDDIRSHRPIIGLDENGDFKTLSFNAHIADIPDFDVHLMYPFYAAYRDLMCRIRSGKYNIEHVLKKGEMVVFDNQRILHGRAKYDPTSGSRYLRGYYIEHNEVDNRIRMLHKHQKHNN